MNTEKDVHMDQPPAQDSPNHILNALNNQCLQECFRRLSTHRDFLNVANVCQRFRENARACFPPTNITIEPFRLRLHFRKADRQQKHWTLDSNMSSKYLGIFLYIFGDLIKSVELDGLWSDTICPTFDDHFAKIVQHCAKTLKTLSFYIFKPIVNIEKTFEMLEILKIHYCSIIYIEPLPCLKVLDIRYIFERSSTHYFSLDRIFKQNYPQLKVLVLDDVFPLNDKLLIDFMTINPHLSTLHVSYCDSITTSILNGINARLPNLEHLTLVFNESVLATETVNDYWMQIGNVCNLKTLRSNVDQIVSTKSVIDLLLENNLPLEKLYVQHAYKSIENDLAKFKNLKIFSAVHWNNKMPTKSEAININTHQWLHELCNLN